MDVCEICQRRREPPQGSACCAVCRLKVRDSLDATVLAWNTLSDDPTIASGSHGYGTESPLPGGTDRLTYLLGTRLMLRYWCRDFSARWSIRLPPDDMELTGRWLRTVWEKLAHTHPEVSLISLQWAAASREGRRLTGLTSPGSLVPCQTPEGEDVCGRRLRVDVAAPEAEVTCRKCGGTWTAARLINLGMEGEDVWLDPEVVERYFHVLPGRLRSWARAGKVRRSHGRYSVADVRAVLDELPGG